MAELIDRNTLLKVLKVLIHRVKGNEDNHIVRFTNNTLELMEEFVQSLPIVNAVPVVFCKERKHCAVASWGERYCARSRFVQLDDLQEDDFCSYGERKDNDL